VSSRIALMPTCLLSAAQVSRENFHRVRMFEAEEAKLRDQLDIFGVPKLPLAKSGNYSPTSR
jgi:hypothetical protein